MSNLSCRNDDITSPDESHLASWGCYVESIDLMIYIIRFLFKACWIDCKSIGWQPARDLPNSHSSNKRAASCFQVFSKNLKKRTQPRCQSPLKSCPGTIEVYEMLCWVSSRLCMVCERKYVMTQVYYRIWMLDISIVDDVNVLSGTWVNLQKEEKEKKKTSINFNGGCDEPTRAFAGEWPYLHSIVSPSIWSVGQVWTRIACLLNIIMYQSILPTLSQ